MPSKFYRFTVRSGDVVTKKFAVQAEDREHAKKIVEETVLTNGEEIMTIEDVSDEMGAKQSLQGFLNNLHDTDRLIVTSGKYVETLVSE